MLEFIVLGQIPGTHIQLTVPWVGASAAVLSMLMALKTWRNHKYIKVYMQRHRPEVISLQRLSQRA